MKRELWSIANAFAYGVRILNAAFCELGEEKELSKEELWMIAEQINSMCSPMMIDDAGEMIKMVQSIPENRLCEKTNCVFHHPENAYTHNYIIFQEKCNKCKWDKKSEDPCTVDNFE